MASLLRGSALALLFGALLATKAVAEPFEKIFGVPEGWKLVGPAADDQSLRLQIALQQGDQSGFEQALLEMSTPTHPKYGQHFQSHEEMKRMLLPSSDAVASVLNWLQEAGINDIEEDSDWINFRTNVGTANKLLDTTFQWYASKDETVRRLRTLQYSIPGDVAQHVNLIQPTTRFEQIRRNHATSRIIDQGKTSTNAAAVNFPDCNEVITPQCLKTIYNIDYTPTKDSGSTIGFCSYLEEYARYNDLELFEENIAPFALGENFSVVLFNGGLNDQNSASDSGEANLDLQYIVGVSSPLPVTEYSTGGLAPWVADLDQPIAADNANEPYLAFLQNVLKLPQSQLPKVLSTSYGENEQSVPKSYALSVCNLFAQLGSRGVSVVFSSGDAGVGDACLSNDGRNITKFQPQYPAACPWVTSVGATQFIDEEATFFSSGGFSDYWARPAYQDAAVDAYLKKLGSQWAPFFNSSGRGFPDVAAQGVDYAVYDKGILSGFEGTSCSTPVFAAIVALLNDARLKAKVPALGFLNPLLYANPEIFNDIVKGGSTGCNGLSRFNGPPNGSPVIPFASWNATVGWDPVTGLGTPNFPSMLTAALPRRRYQA